MSTKTLLKNEQDQKEKNQKYNRRFKLMLIFLPIGLFLSIILAVALGPVTIHPLTVRKIALSHMPFLDNLSKMIVLMHKKILFGVYVFRVCYWVSS